MPLLLNFLYVAISRVMFGDHLRKIPLYKGQNWNHLYAMTYDVELKYFFELYDKQGKFKRPIGEDLLDFQNRYHDEIKEAKAAKRKMKKHLELQGKKDFVQFQPAQFSTMEHQSQQKGAFASSTRSAANHVASCASSTRSAANHVALGSPHRPQPSYAHWVIVPSTPSTPTQPTQFPSSPSASSLQTLVIPVGFKNLGNSCYINSILQCMIAIEPFSNSILTGYLIKTAAHNSCFLSTPASSILRDYCDLVQSISTKRHKSTQKTSNTMIARIHKRTVPTLFTNGHQDAHEFLTSGLLDRFQKELDSSSSSSAPSVSSTSSLSSSLSSNPSSSSLNFLPLGVVPPNLQNFIFKLFYGVDTSILRCQDCFHESITDNDSSVLSLPFPPDKTVPGDFRAVSLSHLDLFEHFTKLEYLEDDLPCQHCAISLSRTNARTKQIFIQEPPPILVIHLKRFNNFSAKKQQFVDFPEEMDISRLLQTSPPSTSSSSSSSSSPFPSSSGSSSSSFSSCSSSASSSSSSSFSSSLYSSLTSSSSSFSSSTSCFSSSSFSSSSTSSSSFPHHPQHLLRESMIYDLISTTQHHGPSIAEGHYTSTVKV